MKFTSIFLRQAFLDYFAKHNHTLVKSSPLIPNNDPSLLFVNAGMVQFKNIFTQKEIASYKTATSSQKCVRAGGKHNDLENVGQTARHHTFFEMLGNFSFGDYFKEQAIVLAYNFLTKELGLDKNRLRVSVFAGDEQVPHDEEAFLIWRDKIGIDEKNILKLGRSDNFWQMGDTGPCGPCSEIYYDRGNLPAGFGNESDDDRIVEIWNLVFMQYEQMPDKTLKKLPSACVDTGMGLERLACVINNLSSNYDTDLFLPLLDEIKTIAHKNYNKSTSQDDMSMRVIADHARATAFLMADGLQPTNENRGYVLRRIMRRAIRHGEMLGIHKPFFHKICLKVIENMHSVYPELLQAKSLIEKLTMQEEENFRKTLSKGIELFNNFLSNSDQKTLSGALVFKLYETYGFPPDLTQDLAKEKNLVINWQEFEEEKQLHESKSGSSLGIKADEGFTNLPHEKTVFLEESNNSSSKIIALFNEQKMPTNILSSKEKGFIILEKTPFYGESGGQVGDTGKIYDEHNLAVVTDTKKYQNIHIHCVEITKGQVTLNQIITAQIDQEKRAEIKRNHSATHLLHSALRNILGEHVTQKGSLVDSERLRFDFSHFAALSNEEIQKVENLVNSWILSNEKATVSLMSLEEAYKKGALALFGEKYQQQVRVLQMGSHSTELCGGTHCHNTGDIGSFFIVSESPLAQGVRRIEAITGEKAVNYARSNELILKNINTLLGCNKESIISQVKSLQEEIKNNKKIIESFNKDLFKQKASEACNNSQLIKNIKLVTQKINFIKDTKDILFYADLIRDKLVSGIVILGCEISSDKCLLLVAITKDLTTSFNAGSIVSAIAPLIGGKGGGRADIAQAGGKESHNLDKALQEAVKIIATLS